MAVQQESFNLGVTAVMLPELDFDEQIALCRETGVTHYSLRPRVIPAEERGKPYSNWGNHKFDLTPERLVKEAGTIRRRLSDAGLTPFGTLPHATVASSDDELKLHFEGAAAVGAGRVRVAPESYPAGVFDYEAALRRAIDGYGRAAALAKPYGLKIVIETHALSLASSPGLAWNICRHFDPAQVGVIFDLSNFACEGMLQPNLAVSVIGRWIDHCHVGGQRRTIGGRDAQGFRRAGIETCSVTESDLYLPDWLVAMLAAGIVVPLVIEDFIPDLPGAERLRQSATALRSCL